MSLRLVVAAALAVVCHGALAQATLSPAASVQQIAPQLVTFAGSPGNFESLVNGLARGGPVQLVSVLPNGLTQTVTFTPAGTLSATQIAQLLEATRQNLIGLGIAAPTAEQLGNALMGGTVPTALGGATAAAGATASPPSPARQVQIQSQPVGSSPVRSNVSDTPFTRNISDSPVSPAPPATQPGAGSSPAATMRVPPAAPGARN
jgi:hypothetical protein